MNSKVGGDRSLMNPMTRDQQPHSTRLILYEKSGEWANRLRRIRPQMAKWIIETRSLNQLAGALQHHPSSFVQVDLSHSNLGKTIQGFAEIRERYPKSLWVAAIPRASEHSKAANRCESILQEFGFACSIRSPRDVSSLSRWWSRHCKLHPPREVTFRELVFDKLPWGCC